MQELSLPEVAGLLLGSSTFQFLISLYFNRNKSSAETKTLIAKSRLDFAEASAKELEFYQTVVEDLKKEIHQLKEGIDEMKSINNDMLLQLEECKSILKK